MNKRCLVNVATGDFYCKMQDRLIDSFLPVIDNLYDTHGKILKTRSLRPVGIDLLIWSNEFPKGSCSHEESPYGFKVHAIKAAYEMGYTSILWIDSPAYAVKEDISPIFDKIEKEGYYAMSHIDPLENWVGDTALRLHELQRSDLAGLNLPSGSCYGFDLSRKSMQIFLHGFATLEGYGLFKSEKISDNGWHRHDEAILALMLKGCSLPVFTFDPLFQSDSPECVIKSGG